MPREERALKIAELTGDYYMPDYSANYYESKIANSESQNNLRLKMSSKKASKI